VALVAAGMVGLIAAPAAAQVTTASMRGTVSDSGGRALEGARITAIHLPSGTQYVVTTRADGRFTIPGMRVGGPYSVAATRLGFQRQSKDDVMLTLGVSTDIEFLLGAVAIQVQAVTVTSEGGDFSSTRTGAATSIGRGTLEALPTIGRTLQDFTRLTPQMSGNNSFAGMDNRLNNITVDGSSLNNSFGLEGAPGLSGNPGARTGVAPISLDAIEAVQVNIAPFDVRQGTFVGAAVNTVTKSGTNRYEGSLYYLMRDQSLVGENAGRNAFDPGEFEFSQIGARLGGPIIKNKLFFFASYESDERAAPATTFKANPGGVTPAGNITRVLASDLDALSSFLATNFNYQTGGYQDYPGATPSMRFTGKLDYSLSERNKFSLRYTHLDSDTDILVSNSSSLGFGTRRSNLFGLNFQNSNYTIMENIRSVIGEWNALVGANMSNNLIIGYTSQDESRGAINADFPMVDILEAGSVYTTFGPEPFTPNNELRYNTFQFKNDFTIYGNKHDLTFGLSVEQYDSENVFFSGRQSAYVYNSLADFYTDANDFLANPTRTVSPVSLRRFQVRYANIPGMVKPTQPLEVMTTGLYVQDEWRALDNLKITAGVRMDMAKFGDTGFENADVAAMTFRDEDGNPAQYSTKNLPKATPLFSPRLGINWDVTGDGVTQVRGGTGIFTGRPAYVWISNQIGNNGIMTGFISTDNTTAFPFHPDPDHYKPPTVTGAPAASYELALTEEDFKFPQVWRSNIAVDRRLPWGMVGTIEYLHGKDINGIYYINANLSEADGAFTGADTRPRWSVDDCPTVSGTQQRLNCQITSAVVLKNQNVGMQWNLSASLERTFRGGLFTKAAYSFGQTRNTVDAGSIAFGSWNNNTHQGDPNNPGLGFGTNYQGHRLFATVAYQRDFFGIGNTGLSMFLERRTNGNQSYVYSGDLNGDGGTSNDLIYIPRNRGEMVFEQFTCSAQACGVATTFTVQQQQDAFEAFIEQDDYLSEHRGQIAERGAVILPTVTRADASFTQDISRLVSGTANTLQLRLDILNLTNMINSDWGLATQLVSNSPLIAAGVDGTGAARYRMRNIGTRLMTRSYQRSASEFDVWRMQFGVRYTFGSSER
jgi:hypothetical protein